MTQMDFDTISTGTQKFVVSQSGSGPDIVLVHGFPDTPHTFQQLRDELVRAGWRVTVPWLRGYHIDTLVVGRSYDPETLGRDGLALLDAIDASQAIVIGHDWGAMTAYVAAALDPRRVPAIVTLALPHPGLLRPTPAALFAARHFLSLKLPWAEWNTRRKNFAYLGELYDRWAPNWHGHDRDETLHQAKQALSSTVTLRGAIQYYRDLPLRRGPVLQKPPEVPGLVIGGTADLSEPSLFTQTAGLMPAPSRALIVDGAGHWPHREDSAMVVPEIVRFADALRR